MLAPQIPPISATTHPPMSMPVVKAVELRQSVTSA